MGGKEIIFIHIPKTGGVSVMHSLFKNKKINYNDTEEFVKYGHMFAKQIKKLRLDYEDIIKFTTIRNPWERLLSTYTFLTKGSEIHKPPESILFNYLYGNINFNELVRVLYKKNKKNDDVFFVNDDIHHLSKNINLYTLGQHNWIFDTNGEKLVDHICYLHKLSEDIKKFNEKYSLNIKLGEHKNKTKHKHYSEVYDDDTREMVRELYSKDIKLFNFKF